MILCATGHRPDKLGGYQNSVFFCLVVLATKAIQDYKPDHVVSGMAQGWDQAWAQAAFMKGVPFTAAVPFEGQEAKWPPSSQRRYNTLLSKAKEVKVVSPGPYEPWKMLKRNEWMVDNSDGCVALWNGDHSGGTYETVKYVERRQQARPDYTLVNLWSDYKRLTKIGGISVPGSND